MPQSDSGLGELLEGLAHEWNDEMTGWFEQAQEDATKRGKERTLRGWVNNYPQSSCIRISLGSTVVFTCIARRSFLLITTVQVWSCSVSSFVPTVTLTMAAPLSVCTKEEQRSVIRFLWSDGVSGAEIHRRLSAQYWNSVLPQRSVYEWIEKFKKRSHKCYAWR